MLCNAYILCATALYVVSFLKSVKMIRVSEETYEGLKKIKVHPRETWDEVVRRLLEAYKKSRGVS